ncbi:MAG TPA: TIGR00730 family Rossman fold protein [Bacillota bacterium]
MPKVICVYSSSSCAIDQFYFDLAAQLGREIARRGDSMLYGGGLVGLMGATAKAVHELQGTVIGVIPKALNLKNVVYENCDELIVTEDLRTRKAIMEQRSDAFIALPGGYGTLEEVLEIITLKQLNYHQKPVVILNAAGFYDKLLEQFELLIDQHFAKPQCRQLYYVTDNVAAALSYIDNYHPTSIRPKWLTEIDEKT